MSFWIVDPFWRFWTSVHCLSLFVNVALYNHLVCWVSRFCFHPFLDLIDLVTSLMYYKRERRPQNLTSSWPPFYSIVNSTRGHKRRCHQIDEVPFLISSLNYVVFLPIKLCNNVIHEFKIHINILLYLKSIYFYIKYDCIFPYSWLVWMSTSEL